MTTKDITIGIQTGLEARPVAVCVQVASQCQSKIYVEHGNVDVLRKEVGLDRESIVKKVIADDRRIEEEK